MLARMKVRALAVPDAFALAPDVMTDHRGAFFEWYRHEALTEAVGHPFRLAQANCSVSRRGTLRGVHYADVPPGQAKYVTCLRGAVLDVVVDIRVGSPTFGAWDAVRLDPQAPEAVYVAEGLGHAFTALTEEATVAYLCSEVYAPGREHAVHPLDPALGIEWPRNLEPLVSEKDAAAPALHDAAAAGMLPRYEDCRALYERLDREG
jgi:dTDP-4-dehydrorhamnose 3,5-epimerase